MTTSTPPPDPLGIQQGGLAELGARYARPRTERWSPVPVELDDAIAADAELARAARAERERLVRTVAVRLGGLARSYLDALLEVPRERFVLPEDIAASAEDVPLALDPFGLATVSAPHAYLLTFRLLDLREGDHLLELGTGTGYGAQLARVIVGATGCVTTIEIDPDLFVRARRLLLGPEAGTPAPTRAAAPEEGCPGRDAGIRVFRGDAHLAAPRLLEAPAPPRAIAVTYAMRALPAALVDALPEGGVLVAPVGPSEESQELVRCERCRGVVTTSRHGAVRYVTDRSPVEDATRKLL